MGRPAKGEREKQLDATHRFLFSKAGRLGKLTINQKALAAEMGVGHVNFHRQVQELIAIGRLKVIGEGARGGKTVVVREP